MDLLFFFIILALPLFFLVQFFFFFFLLQFQMTHNNSSSLYSHFHFHRYAAPIGSYDGDLPIKPSAAANSRSDLIYPDDVGVNTFEQYETSLDLVVGAAAGRVRGGGGIAGGGLEDNEQLVNLSQISNDAVSLERIMSEQSKRDAGLRQLQQQQQQPGQQGDRADREQHARRDSLDDWIDNDFGDGL